MVRYYQFADKNENTIIYHRSLKQYEQQIDHADSGLMVRYYQFADKLNVAGCGTPTPPFGYVPEWMNDYLTI